MRAASLWILLGSLIAIASCSANDADRDAAAPLGTARAAITTTAPALVLGPQVYLVPAAAGAQIQSDRVVITATTALIPGGAGAGKTAAELAAGDFLINDYGAPGFVRAVTSVSTSADTTTALTRRAGLDEVLQTGGVTEIVPNLASGGAGDGSPAPSVGAPSVHATPASVPLPGFDLPIAFPTVTLDNVTVAVKPGSHLAFDPDLDIGLSLGLFSVNEFHAILRGALTGRLELDIRAALAQTAQSFDLQVFPALDVTVPLPPTPLTLAARLRVFVGCTVQADAAVNVDTGFTLSGSLTAGAHFRDGAWGADGALPTFGAINPTFGAGASLHASCELRPRLELLLEGLVGPFIEVTPSVYGDLTFAAPPPTIAWDVGWALTGKVGGTLDVLFHQFTLGPVQIFNRGASLARGTTTLGAGYCNTSANCPSGQSCSGHSCVAAPPPPPPPPPPTDNCAGALNGVYCGFSTMDGFSGHGDSHTIYSCSAHRTTGTTHCSTTCQIAQPGLPDTCPASANNCSNAANGIYCGLSTMDGFLGHGDSRTLYTCSGHVNTSQHQCLSPCKIAPPGAADFCQCGAGPLCGTRCCGAGQWCGTGNQCCSGCSPGCPC